MILKLNVDVSETFVVPSAKDPRFDYRSRVSISPAKDLPDVQEDKMHIVRDLLARATTVWMQDLKNVRDPIIVARSTRARDAAAR